MVEQSLNDAVPESSPGGPQQRQQNGAGSTVLNLDGLIVDLDGVV